MDKIYTLAAWYCRDIAEQCRNHGLDHSTLDALAPDLEKREPKSRLPVELALKLLDATAKASGHPDIALRIGFELRPNSLSDLEHFSAACKTFVEAVTFNRNYPGLRQDLGLLNVETGPDGECVVVWETDHDQPERYRRFTELVMARYSAFGNHILMRMVADPEDGRTLEVRFRHNAPAYADAYSNYWPRSKIRFGMAVDSTVHPPALHSTQLGIYSPIILDVLRRKLDEDMSAFSHATDVVSSVRAAIRSRMEEGHINLQIIAEALDRTPSQLRHELRESSASFRALVESERKRACVALIESQSSLSDVALSLGYNDQPAFNRAFKRWFAVSPSNWMKQSV